MSSNHCSGANVNNSKCSTGSSYSHLTTLSNSTSIPTTLRKLKLELTGPFRDLYSREGPDQSTFTELHTFLDGQTQLEEVYFDFSSFPVKWTV